MSETTAGLAPLSGAAHGRVHQRQPFVWRVQQWLANYLPLALMAALALFSYWLLRQNPVPEGPTETRPLRHVADYEMQGFELLRYLPDGRQQAWLQGETLRHFPDDDSIEVERLQLRLVADDGRVMLAEAERATGPSKGEPLELKGSVRVRRYAPGADLNQAQPELEVQTEALTVWQSERRLKGKVPVRLIAPPRLQLDAAGFEYEHGRGLLRFKGPSHTQIQALPRR